EPYARLLYARLKSLDQPGRSYIIVEKPPLGQAWDGVNDRLRRAAHGNHLPALRGPDLEKQP
ncbi:MAG TPA: Sua5 family C-terminal domain-containing protein, partial [Candidatus Obscuribacter sp.]|nr:Sua5 family C-terminal domain-containing protein [Candidatus Obscuribacter sp.]